jgi:hypothetical protein
MCWIKTFGNGVTEITTGWFCKKKKEIRVVAYPQKT